MRTHALATIAAVALFPHPSQRLLKLLSLDREASALAAAGLSGARNCGEAANTRRN